MLVTPVSQLWDPHCLGKGSHRRFCVYWMGMEPICFFISDKTVKIDCDKQPGLPGNILDVLVKCLEVSRNLCLEVSRNL